MLPFILKLPWCLHEHLLESLLTPYSTLPLHIPQKGCVHAWTCSTTHLEIVFQQDTRETDAPAPFLTLPHKELPILPAPLSTLLRRLHPLVTVPMKFLFICLTSLRMKPGNPLFWKGTPSHEEVPHCGGRNTPVPFQGTRKASSPSNSLVLSESYFSHSSLEGTIYPGLLPRVTSHNVLQQGH